jgi:hypothetical protein
MLPIHWRLGELHILNQSRELTNDEMQEMAHCLHLNATYARKLAELYNLSLVASMTDDMEWLDSVYADIDKLEIQYKIKKPAQQ